MRKIWIFLFITFSTQHCFAGHSSFQLTHRNAPHVFFNKSTNELDLSPLLHDEMSLAVKNPDTGEISYTHNGHFTKVHYYFYQNKNRLQGFSTLGLEENMCKLMDVQIPRDSVPPQATRNITITRLNLNASSTVPVTSFFSPENNSSYNFSTGTGITDTLGETHKFTIYVQKQMQSNTWKAYVVIDDALVKTGILTFSTNGELATMTGLSELTFIPKSGMPPQALHLSVERITQYAGAYETYPMTHDGTTGGDATEEVVDANGFISENYTDGQTLTFSKIAVYNR
jgi:flagellar hook protein FlgE